MDPEGPGGAWDYILHFLQTRTVTRPTEIVPSGFRSLRKTPVEVHAFNRIHLRASRWIHETHTPNLLLVLFSGTEVSKVFLCLHNASTGLDHGSVPGNCVTRRVREVATKLLSTTNNVLLFKQENTQADAEAQTCTQ